MRRRDTRQGFILVSVLGALIVLGGLVAAISYLVSTAVMGAAATRETLVVDALARAGVELAGYELFTLRRPAAAVNGQRIRLDDGVVTLFVTAESGKIDLNGADPELLSAAWSAVGAPGMQPEAFAARVKDYRDLDEETSDKGGAEAAEYSASGPNRAPANAAFESVDDVQNVLGVSVASAQALAPLLTVHNPSGKVSAYEATPAVLRALPGRNVAERVAALRARPPAEQNGGRQDGEQGSQQAGQQGGQQDPLGDLSKFLSLERNSPAFSVRVEVERAGARRSEDLILTLSRSPDAPYFVTDRRERPSG